MVGTIIVTTYYRSFQSDSLLVVSRRFRLYNLMDFNTFILGIGRIGECGIFLFYFERQPVGHQAGFASRFADYSQLIG